MLNTNPEFLTLYLLLLVLNMLKCNSLALLETVVNQTETSR